MKRHWFWYTLGRGDVLGAAFVLVLLVALAFLAVAFPAGVRQTTNAGFGPEWDCKLVPQSEPICVKRIDRK
jgi:hypothetical protein